MKIFAMNIYMGIFTRNININMFMNIYRTLFVQAHLLKVDLLNPRILQTDALLMHSGAEKNKLTS